MRNFPIKKDGTTYWISRSVAAVVYVYTFIDGNLCVLANKRGPGCPGKIGLWNCPSGFVDYDETIEDAAVREVWEETGIKIYKEDLRLIEVDSDPSKTDQNILVRYRCYLRPEESIETTDEHSEPNEVSEIKWIPLMEVGKYEWVSEKHKEVAVSTYPPTRIIE